jgi:hypothetical protein
MKCKESFTRTPRHGARSTAESVAPRHCARSKAIAYTTDGFSALAAAASCLNCDFKVINLIHIIILNHSNHIKITVRTISRRHGVVLRNGIKPNTTQNTDSHLLILNSPFSILNSHENHMEITVRTKERMMNTRPNGSHVYSNCHDRRGATPKGSNVCRDGLGYKHVNPSDSLCYREEQPRHCARSTAESVAPRHCARSKAIAYTTDGFSALATASSRLNCDFNMINLIHMIILNHLNHSNHIKITVQTIIYIHAGSACKNHTNEAESRLIQDNKNI